MRNSISINCYNSLKNAEKIIIGLSGGADSVALTHILFKEFGSEKLICAHVNHMIRGDEADRDQNFAQSYAESLGIRFELCKANILDIAENMGIGTEECGRQIRYEFFDSLAKNENYFIATAHNADDNAETVIMNLIKGSGTAGLCGIPVQRGNIVRPILSLARGEIEDYCKANDLSYIVDSSNLTNDYDRNRVRHIILPELSKLNSSATANINRTASILWEDNDFLNSLAMEKLSGVKGRYGLNVLKLRELHISVLSRVILMYLKDMDCGRIEKKHIDSIVSAIRTGSDAVAVPGNKLVYVKQNCLSVFTAKNSSVQGENSSVRITEGETLVFADKTIKISKKNFDNNKKINNLLFNNSFDYDTITGSLWAGHRLQGDKITLLGRSVTKSLKKLFVEMKIPPSVRDELVVIRDDEQVIFVENVGVCAKFAITGSTKNIGVIEIE